MVKKKAATDALGSMKAVMDSFAPLKIGTGWFMNMDAFRNTKAVMDELAPKEAVTQCGNYENSL